MSHSHDSSCHSEHHDHDHGSHDHSDDITPALQNILHSQIDFDRITTLNERTSNSGRAICRKAWSDRLTSTPSLISDADAQLIILIPFTGQVRLHSLLIRTSASPSSPRTLKLFVNADSLDFDGASDVTPTQELSISMTSEVQEIPVRRAFFNTTRCLALFFEDNWSGDEDAETEIGYLGFKGDFMKLNREAVSVLYESAANPSDHKVIGGIAEGVGRSVQ
jgi:hypothetical protein